MNDALWLGAIALLAAPGTIAWRVPIIAGMDRSARIALAWIGGILIAALMMYAYALAGVHWSRVNIAIPLIAIASLGVRPLPTAFERRRRDAAVHVVVVIFLALTVYAVADARATCGDLMYIWAPKAEAFSAARTIDVEFLKRPFYHLMHADYPPLVPFVYDIGSIFTHHFAWHGALFLSPLILLSIAAVLRGFGASAIAATGVFGLLSFAYVSAYLPGGADPFLVLFESVAVIALTFAPESREARWVASAAIAAAAFTKVEGTTFAIIIVIAFLITQRRLKAALVLLLPAAALLATWLLFVWRHKLFEQYARAHAPMYWKQLPAVISDVADRASFHAWWIPWIAAIAPLFVHRAWRRAALPLFAAAGSLAAMVFFYLHDPQPAFWIATSADRVLVTPLMCIAIAGSVSAEPHVSSRAP